MHAQVLFINVLCVIKGFYRTSKYSNFTKNLAFYLVLSYS